MFKKNDYTVVKDLYLDKPAAGEVKWTESFFDREGYELNAIEKDIARLTAKRNPNGWRNR